MKVCSDISSDLFLWNIIISLPMYLSRKIHSLTFSFSFSFCVDAVWDCRSLWLEGRWWYHCPTPHCTAPMPAVISSMGMWHSDKLPSCPCSLAPLVYLYVLSDLYRSLSFTVIGLEKIKICWMQMWTCRMSVHATLEYMTHVVGKYKYTMLVIGDSL